MIICIITLIPYACLIFAVGYNFKNLLKQINMDKTPYTLQEQYEAAGYVKGREEGVVSTLEVFKQYKAGLSMREIAKRLSLKYELVKNTINEAKKLGLI